MCSPRGFQGMLHGPEMFNEVHEAYAVCFVHTNDLPSCLSTVGPAHDGGIDEDIVRLLPILKRDVDGGFGPDGYRFLSCCAPTGVRQIPNNSIGQGPVVEVAEVALNRGSQLFPNGICFHRVLSLVGMIRFISHPQFNLSRTARIRHHTEGGWLSSKSMDILSIGNVMSFRRTWS